MSHILVHLHCCNSPLVHTPLYPPQLPRAKVVVSAPDVLSPSGPDEADEFCRAVFGEDWSSGQLESWVENLREWLSRQVRVMGGEPQGMVVETGERRAGSWFERLTGARAGM